jgi:ABC-type siderophore export system fused ATPase/permease subunit
MWLLAVIVFFAAALLAHAITCRLPIPGNSVIRFLTVGSALGGGLIAVLLYRYGVSAQLLAGVMLYAFACELYIFLFTLAMSSVSANLLVNLATHDMTQAEVDRRYDSASMVSNRIERLIVTGLLKETGQVIRPTAKGLRLLSAFDALRRFFGHMNPGDSRQS